MREAEKHQAHLSAFSALMGGEDESTIQHCLRLRADSVTMGRAMGMQARELRDLEYAALLHDIGMFRIPLAIREEHGELSDAAWEQVHRHPDLGADMVAEITTLENAAVLIRGHHERWDGEGYPRGLIGDAIPLGSRILALVDTFDSICERADCVTPEVLAGARTEIAAQASTQFDPAVVAAFEGLFSRLSTRRIALAT